MNPYLSSLLNEQFKQLNSKVSKSQTINGISLDNNILLTKNDIPGLESIDTTSDIQKPISLPQQIAFNLKADKSTTINSHPLSNNIFLNKIDIGLDQVDNTSDIDKPVSLPQQQALIDITNTINNLKVNKSTTINSHSLSTNINLNKSDIGLGNVDNTTDLDKPISNAQQTIFNNINQNMLLVSSTLNNISSTVNSVNNYVPKSTTINSYPLSSNIILNKSDFNLDNVDNTSDINKPISTLTQSLIDSRTLVPLDNFKYLKKNNNWIKSPDIAYVGIGYEYNNVKQALDDNKSTIYILSDITENDNLIISQSTKFILGNMINWNINEFHFIINSNDIFITFDSSGFTHWYPIISKSLFDLQSFSNINLHFKGLCHFDLSNATGNDLSIINGSPSSFTVYDICNILFGSNPINSFTIHSGSQPPIIFINIFNFISLNGGTPGNLLTNNNLSINLLMFLGTFSSTIDLINIHSSTIDKIYIYDIIQTSTYNLNIGGELNLCKSIVNSSIVNIKVLDNYSIFNRLHTGNIDINSCTNVIVTNSFCNIINPNSSTLTSCV